MKSLSWRRKPRCQSVSGCKADIRAASSSCRSSSSPFFARPSFCDRSGEYRDANTTANVRQDYQSARTKRKTPPERENRHCWRSRRSSYFERESVQQRQLSSLVHYERNRKSNKKSAKVKEKKSLAIFKKFALIVTDHKITMSKKIIRVEDAHELIDMKWKLLFAIANNNVVMTKKQLDRNCICITVKTQLRSDVIVTRPPWSLPRHEVGESICILRIDYFNYLENAISRQYQPMCTCTGIINVFSLPDQIIARHIASYLYIMTVGSRRNRQRIARLPIKCSEF